MVNAMNFKGCDRDLVLTAEPVEKDAEFCWNYGPHEIKLGPYIELRPKEAREFIKDYDFNQIDELIGYFVNVISREKLPFEKYVLEEKFRYILETPPVLFAMNVDGTLSIPIAEKLQKLVNLLEKKLVFLHSTVERAKDCLTLSEKIKVYPLASQVFSRMIDTLPSRLDMFDIIHYLLVIKQKIENILQQSSKDKHERMLLSFLEEVTQLVDKKK